MRAEGERASAESDASRKRASKRRAEGERSKRSARCESKASEQALGPMRVEGERASARPDASRRRASKRRGSHRLRRAEQPRGRRAGGGLELGEVLGEEMGGAVDDPKALGRGHLRDGGFNRLPAAVFVVGALDDGL